MKYRDLLQDAHNDRIKRLKIASKNNDFIMKKQQDYINNIEDDLDVNDTRSNYERNQDFNYIYQIIEEKVNKLFDYDHIEVSKMMEFIKNYNVSIDEFNVVYNEILKSSDPRTNTAEQIIQRMKKLIHNEYETGSIHSSYILKDIYNLIETAFKKGSISERQADEMVDKSEALFEREWNDIESISSSNEEEKEWNDDKSINSLKSNESLKSTSSNSILSLKSIATSKEVDEEKLKDLAIVLDKEFPESDEDDVDMFCRVCNKHFKRESAFAKHEKTQSHKNKLESYSIQNRTIKNNY